MPCASAGLHVRVAELDVACVQEGQKPIYHLEAFVAKFMSEYKNWSITAFR